MGLFDDFFGQAAASGTTAAGTSTTGGSSGGSVFLDIFETAAEWDVLRRTGLPNTIDGGVQPVSDIQTQNAERTPPAPPGGSSAFSLTPSNIAIGGALAVALIGLVLVARS